MSDDGHFYKLTFLFPQEDEHLKEEEEAEGKEEAGEAQIDASIEEETESEESETEGKVIVYDSTFTFKLPTVNYS